MSPGFFETIDLVRRRENTGLGSSQTLPAPGQTQKLELVQAQLGGPVVIAYGRHIVGGNVLFQQEQADKSRKIAIALGEGELDALEVLLLNGVPHLYPENTLYHFHPGLDGALGVETDPAVRNQKICSLLPTTFSPQLTNSRLAYLFLNLPADPTAPGPEADIRGIYRCLRVRIFDSSGAQTAYAYSTNPAWCLLDVLIRRWLNPHGLINEALTTAMKAKINFPSFVTWATDCDFALSDGKRFECHVAFTQETSLLAAMELILLSGRGYLLERDGQFVAQMDKARASQYTAGRDALIQAPSLMERDVFDRANKIIVDGRVLNSGEGVGTIATTGTTLTGTGTRFLEWYKADDAIQVLDGAQAGEVALLASVTSDTAATLKAAFSANQSGRKHGNPAKDFQIGPLGKSLDEDHQDQTGRVNEFTLDLQNTTLSRVARLGTYQKGLTQGMPRKATLNLKGASAAGAANPFDLEPGDRITGPLDTDGFSTLDYEILELTDEPDFARQAAVREYSEAHFVDTVVAQRVVQPAAPGTGLPPVTGAGNYAYRPRSNPLTATDAGASATINVAAFTMEISQVGQKSISSGSITLLSFNTLYFVAYKDPEIKGGAVVFEAFTTKEDALKEGRFFAGSITTPKDGAPDTIGNNDGGVGAQIGSHIFRKPTVVTKDADSQELTATQPLTKSKDEDWTTFGGVIQPADGNLTGLIFFIELSGFGFDFDLGFSYKNVKLRFKNSGSVTNETGGTVGTSTLRARYSTNGGTSWTDFRSTTAVGAGNAASLAVAMNEVTLADGTDPRNVKVRIELAAHTGGTLNDGSLGLEAYEAVLEAQT